MKEGSSLSEDLTLHGGEEALEVSNGRDFYLKSDKVVEGNIDNIRNLVEVHNVKVGTVYTTGNTFLVWNINPVRMYRNLGRNHVITANYDLARIEDYEVVNIKGITDYVLVVGLKRYVSSLGYTSRNRFV